MDNAGAPPSTETISGIAVTSPPSSPKSGPLFERGDWQSFGVTAVLVLVVYLYTLSPSIDLSWSGILSTAAMHGGVPHPPGFPLWTIYAHVFTIILPFSNIAWRISVSSAFASAVACGLIALTVSRGGALMLENVRGLNLPDRKSEKWLQNFAGYAAGMSFGLSASVWGHSVVPDWWPLTFAIFAGVICLMVRWTYSPKKMRYLYAAMLLFSLALTNSQSLMVALFGLELFILFVSPTLGRDLFALTTLLFVPVLITTYHDVNPSLWLVYLILASACFLIASALVVSTRRIFTRWKATLACAALITLALCLYFYSAIASMTNPPMDWGYPRTVEGFYHLVSRGQYESIMPVHEWPRYWSQIQLYADYALHDYGWVYLLPAIIPLLVMHRLGSTERRWMLGLLALFLCQSFFLIGLLNPSNDRSSVELHSVYLAPSYLTLAIWTGCGLVLLGARLAGPHERKVSTSKPHGDDPMGGEADEKAREEAWKQAREISKKI